MQDSITHEALEALSKKAQEPGALIADKGAFLVALETAYRTGQLILAVPSDPWAGQAELLDECQKAASELDRQALANIRTLTDAQPSGDEVEAACARIQALETSLAEAEKWRSAVDDALVTSWLGTSDSFPDARTALDKLIEWHMTIAVDPAVSKPAADLVKEARRQALEEAAKVADAKWDHWRNEHAKTGEATALFIAETCESIGIAIRVIALLDRQE